MLHTENIFGKDKMKLLARHIVVNEFGKELYLYKSQEEFVSISADSRKHLNIIIVGSDDLLLYVARQIVLLCHFPNFNDDSGQNRSVMTFIVPDKNKLDDTIEDFSKLTSKLLTLGALWKSYIIGKDFISREGRKSNLEYSFLDFEFRFIGLDNISIDDYFAKNDFGGEDVVTSIIYADEKFGKAVNNLSRVCDDRRIFFLDKQVLEKEVSEGVDVRCAKLVNALYDIGSGLREIKDIYEAKQYRLSLAVLCKYTRITRIDEMWNRKDIGDRLSSLLCADCFDVKLNTLRYAKGRNKKKRDAELIDENLYLLAKTEHARWNIEKFITGFSPYSKEQLYEDEILYGDERRVARKRLKKQKVHINLCSYLQLKRIDPESFKYDCFLSLAMDEIIKKSKKM